LVPVRLVAKDGVEDREQLPGDRDQRDFRMKTVVR
jgi:hypothetical protein